MGQEIIVMRDCIPRCEQLSHVFFCMVSGVRHCLCASFHCTICTCLGMLLRPPKRSLVRATTIPLVEFDFCDRLLSLETVHRGRGPHFLLSLSCRQVCWQHIHIP